MRTVVAACVICACAVSAIAETRVPIDQLPPAEREKRLVEFRAKLKENSLKKTGGRVRKEGSAKGVYMILNAQKNVSVESLRPAIDVLTRLLCIQAEVKNAAGTAISVATVKDEITKAGGVLGVAIVDCEGLPAFLSASEDGWAIVNVRPLAKDAEKDVLASRVRKEILRAYAFVSGGVCQGEGSGLMRDVIRPLDLDAISHESYPIDIMSHIERASPFYGLKPYYETTYRQACSEGWAPSPTNDYQRAIWDEYHTVPTAPMKIKFDKTLGK